jgi:DNA replication and repair protein RecF
MQITLRNWRCFENTDFFLPRHSFFLCDNNGSGKTSLISAIYSLYTRQAWQNYSLKDCLKSGENYFGVASENGSYLSLTINSSGKITTKWQSPPQTLEIYTYTPFDNYWLDHSRGEKLKILDNLLSQVFGLEYQKALKKLSKIVVSKSLLLKRQLENPSSENVKILQDFTRQIFDYSSILWSFRKQFWEILQLQLPEFGAWINLELKNWQIDWLVTHSTTKTLFRKGAEIDLNKILQTEILVGQVLFGSQRDDFEFVSNFCKIQKILSRGETRFFVLFIKCVASQITKKNSLWLLDDIFNELDSAKEKLLFDKILSQIYFIATGTKPNLEIPTYSLANLTKK